ncbi:collagen alpha-6(VI) chain-like [Carcharodon carcharias]|uniref:collagen alpha-6(VI) chain-like n=1 Tax=Carcharodon carcharias TaxID=13397 RepID=UPI001B7EFB0F|nr:collagen alpha-6(VI) chain-like [Carcharodon carcharias]
MSSAAQCDPQDSENKEKEQPNPTAPAEWHLSQQVLWQLNLEINSLYHVEAHADEVKTDSAAADVVVSALVLHERLKLNKLLPWCGEGWQQGNAAEGHYADVVFLIDGSQNMARQDFQQVRIMLIKMLNRLDIGANRYRIGLAQYNEQAKTEFLLNRYQDKNMLLSFLKKSYRFKPGPTLNTGRALDYLRKNFFTASAGSRKLEGVPQIAVVITSMKSQDDVTKGAAALRNDGIKILSIGIKDSDLQELETMAFLPTYPYVYQLPPSPNLNLLITTITKMVHDASQPEKINNGHQVCHPTSVADVVFIVDESSSIGKINFHLVLEFLYNLVKVLDVGPQMVHIGLVQYSTLTTPVFHLNTFQNKADILKQIQKTPYKGGGTYTGEAINYVRERYFAPEAGSRINEGVPQIAMVITDGKSQDSVVEPAIALRRSGVSVYAFGIKDAVESELRKIASFPPERYVHIIQSFDLLKKSEEQLQKKICNEIHKWISVVQDQTERLHQGCAETEEADIFFLIDGSGSIGPESFQDLKRFVIEIMKVFSVGTDRVHVGVVQYADSAQTECEIMKYTHKMELEQAIKKIIQIGGGTKTGHALTYMKNFIWEAERSRKARVQRFLITITDGRSQDDVTSPAVELRQQGVTVYAVGVGDANKKELGLIAGADERVLYTDNFDTLIQMKNSILLDICSREVCSKLGLADIIFLIDGSGNINAQQFMKMKEFIDGFVKKINLGLDNVHIGLIQFSSKPKAEFQLNVHSVKADLHRAIDNIQQLTGNAYTGQALSFTADYFDKAKGGRPDIPQYLILITNGEAQDAVLQPAKAIRDKGITVFAVGVFNANRAQLLEIGGASDKVYYVENFELLEEIEKQVLWEICSGHKDCWKAGVTDVVFVIDGTQSISSAQFNIMKSFMTGLVNGSDVAADKVQFGAVLYGDSPQTVFKLDQFTKKDDIYNAIYGMNPVGGYTYTAKALNYAKGLFDPTGGGRKQLGVPQILLLLTVGQATDKQQLNSAAEAIRASGINIYAIGVANANKNELLQIAGSQENTHYFPEFETLELKTKSMSQKFCHDSKPDCEVHEADIVFLIAGSESINANDFKFMKDFLKYMVKMFNTGPTEFQFAVAQFSTDTVTAFHLNDTHVQTELVDKIENIKQLPAGELTREVFKLVKDLFQPSVGSRKLKGVPQYLLVITDEVFKDKVIAPANDLRKENINVFAIGIGQANENQLVQISGAPERKFYIKNFAELDKIKRRIVRKLCTAPAEDLAADVVFLVEGNQNAEAFKQLQSFIKGIITQLNVGPRKYRIGLSQFGKDVKTEFLLKQFVNKKDVLNHIKKSYRFQGGVSLDIPHAFDYLIKTHFIASAGSRKNEDIPQIAVIITNKSSQAAVKTHSKALIQDGVTVFSIAVSEFDQPEKAIDYSSYPFLFQNFYLHHAYQHSVDVAHTIRNITKQERTLKQPAVCLSALVADIVYIVDESGSIGDTNFELIRNFLVSVISLMDIGPDKVQIGLIQYSTYPTSVFYLNRFQTKSDVLDRVRTIPYRKGRTETGAAIDYAMRNYFIESRGSRMKHGIPQIAVVITDGQAADDVKGPAIALRRLGVKVFACGIKDANKTELQIIASYPPENYVFNIESFDRLKTEKHQIQKKVCNTIKKIVSTEPNEQEDLEQGCVFTEADIFFLVHASTSENFQEVRKFLQDTTRFFSISENQVRVGIVQYAENPETVFKATQCTSKTELERAIQQISQITGNTNTGHALTYMKRFTNEAKRTSVPRFLITITDRQSQDDVTTPAEEIRQQGVTVYAVGVGDIKENELQLIAGDNERVFYMRNIDALSHVKNSIARDICSKEACRLKADIIFLIDGSSSITSDNFQKMKAFMITFVNQSNIGPDNVQIGVIQYSTNPNPVFQLNNYFSRTDLRRKIDNIMQLTGNTHTGQALNFTADYFNEAKGGRPDIPQYLIVVTDGAAQDDVLQPAKAIRDKGVIVFALGVLQANYSQLQEIGGSNDKVHYINSFDLLTEVQKKILWSMCKPRRACKTTEVVDILFVIDGSGSIEPDMFEIMKIFMETLVNQTNVGANKTQIGAMMFSDSPKTLFQMNELRTKAAVQKKIRQLNTLGGSTYTVEALKHAMTLLSGANGGRKEAGVPQFLLLITDGEATNKLGLNDTAVAIRNSGVHVFAIGVAPADERELRMIGGSDEYWFYATNISHLEYLSQNISDRICLETKEDCTIEEADVVFLVDGSGSISSNNFTSMKTFLKYIIKTLTMGSKKFQFALVQYSTSQVIEFNLSDNFIVNKIDKIIKLDGGTQTGKALRFVKGLFEPSAGSRKLKGVPQSLLVITDGRSSDKVAAPANDLRKENINILAIGIGDAKEAELLQISGAPERKFLLSGFKELDKIKRRITRELCSKSQACSIDIAVGFDSSNQRQFENIFAGQDKLRVELDEILRQITSLTKISCVSNSKMEVRVALYVQNEKEQVVHETRFDKNISKLADGLQGIKMDSQVSLNAKNLKSFLRKFNETDSKVKVIVIFTDGLDDTLDQLKQTSQVLKKNGIHSLIPVALEGALNVNEIPYIEFGTGFAYKEQLSIGMKDIGNALLYKISAVAEKQCCDVNCVCTGELGRPGNLGSHGMKGNDGLPGFPGHPGTDGEEGKRGPPGVTGPAGFIGCSGNRGRKGNRGYRGTKGSGGDYGIDGIDGEQGENGELGSAGVKGKPGYLGKKGWKGDMGVRGQLGIPGDPGTPGISKDTAGEKGIKGAPGQQGEMGIHGDGGSAGLSGSRGPRGSRGMLGTKGANGSDGKRGHKGDPGIQGPQGEPGSPGSKGQNGGRGSRGQQGLNGIAGSDGIDGNLGAKGHTGQHGQPGIKGTKGQAGPRGSPGMDGTGGFGSPGIKGRKGEQGNVGNPGLQGEAGEPGQLGKDGPKGARGQRGNAGFSGEPGIPGDFGDPGPSGSRGPPGIASMTQCELTTYIRNNCPCCSKRRGECPAYPTELVFALDTSSDVTPAIFQRMKRIVINFLQDINIAESNCPTGARVAVLTYNDIARPFIRFSDFKKKALLVKEIEALAHERSNRRRNIGVSMQFVSRNTFKRVRNGALVRKIAVFITNGGSQDTAAVSAASIQYSASGITPVIISFKNIPDIKNIFRDAVVVLSRQQQASQEMLRQVQLCTLCFDVCEPHEECEWITSPIPIPVNLDLAFIVDDLEQMETAESETVQQFLNSMLNQFISSSEPKASDLQPRVALVQHTSNSAPGYGKGPFKLEFGVLDYTAKTLKKRHIQDSFFQLEDFSGIGNSIEWSLKNFFPSLTNQHIYKVIFTIFSGRTIIDEKKLLEISQEAKCKGFAMFALALGEVTNVTVLEEFVSFPFDQHLVQLDRVLEPEMEYAQKFSVAFLKNLAMGINNYPPAALQRECGGIKSQRARETRASADLERANMMQNMEGLKANINGETLIERQGNTFSSEDNKVLNVCELNVESGSCYSYNLKWFFDATEQVCKRFWYGGCGGNKNRFDTRKECEALCLKSAF